MTRDRFLPITVRPHVVPATAPKKAPSALTQPLLEIAALHWGQCTPIRVLPYSYRNASTGFSRAARMLGTIVARNETAIENAAITSRSTGRVMNGIDETK